MRVSRWFYCILPIAFIVNLCFTTSSLIWPPYYYNYYFTARQNVHTFSYKKNTPLMRPTTTFLIPNVHIYFVFNLVNTTTNTDKRQQKRMSAIMMITALSSRYSCSRDWYTVSLLKMSRFIFVLCGSRRYDMLWMFNKHCVLSLRRSELVSVHVA